MARRVNVEIDITKKNKIFIDGKNGDRLTKLRGGSVISNEVETPDVGDGGEPNQADEGVKEDGAKKEVQDLSLEEEFKLFQEWRKNNA